MQLIIKNIYIKNILFIKLSDLKKKNLLHFLLKYQVYLGNDQKSIQMNVETTNL